MFSEFQVSMPSVLTADHRELLRVPVCVVSVRYLPEEGRSGGETEVELEKKKRKPRDHPKTPRTHIQVRQRHIRAICAEDVPKLRLPPCNAVDEYILASPDGEVDRAASAVAPIAVFVHPHLAVSVE